MQGYLFGEQPWMAEEQSRTARMPALKDLSARIIYSRTSIGIHYYFDGYK